MIQVIQMMCTGMEEAALHWSSKSFKHEQLRIRVRGNKSHLESYGILDTQALARKIFGHSFNLENFLE